MNFLPIINGTKRHERKEKIYEVDVVFLLIEYILHIQVCILNMIWVNLVFVDYIWFIDLDEGERHWLRLLLHHVHGAKTFEDLRTLDNVVYATFKEATIAKGLLEDDREVTSCLHESSTIRSGHAFCELFALI
jgi:hypothetical protein